MPYGNLSGMYVALRQINVVYQLEARYTYSILARLWIHRSWLNLHCSCFGLWNARTTVHVCICMLRCIFDHQVFWRIMFSYRQIREWHSRSDSHISSEMDENSISRSVDSAFDRSYVRTKLENGLLRVWRVCSLFALYTHMWIWKLCVAHIMYTYTAGIKKHLSNLVPLPSV